MGGTVVFGVDKNKVDKSVYSLRVETVCTNAGGYTAKKEHEKYL